MGAFEERVEEILAKAKECGCEHVGKLPPKEFQCIDCEDTADKCNCNGCAGVFCDKCNSCVWISCDDVRTAWKYLKINVKEN